MYRSRVHALAQQGKLEYFDYHPEKEQEAAAFCIEIIKVPSLLDQSHDTGALQMPRPVTRGIQHRPRKYRRDRRPKSVQSI